MPAPIYVDYAFENGSPAEWEAEGEDGLLVMPLYDHASGSANRQLTHWHVHLHCPAPRRLRLRIPPVESIYDGQRVYAFAPVVGSVRRHGAGPWTPFAFHRQPDRSILAELDLPAGITAISRAEPYTTADLAAWIGRLRTAGAASVEEIGHSVAGRGLELVTLGSGRAPRSILVRARAHAWESGGSWFSEGMAEAALAEPAAFRDLDLCFLPMAAKDGVVLGRTRFNLHGIDLNRGFGAPGGGDPVLAPENHHLLAWLDRRRAAGALPAFALDLHNDDEGDLHVGEIGTDPAYDRRIAALEARLRRDTWFRERIVPGTGGGTSFGPGLRRAYGIDAVILELNSNRCAGAGQAPTSAVWRTYGRQFALALAAHLGAGT